MVLIFTLLFLVAGNENARTPNYSVLETDYDSYAIVYNCANFLFFKFGELTYVSSV